jgi:hypothetical protein
MNKLNITRVAIAASITGALVAAIGFASGAKSTNEQPASASFTDPATLPQFEHARVVNATPEQIAALARESANSAHVVGQRAYIDANTKQLRPAFPDELAAEAAAARSAPAVASTAPIVSTTDEGARGMSLDESFMSYATARIEPDGSVKQDCLENQPSEKAALQAAAAAPGVDSHDK